MAGRKITAHHNGGFEPVPSPGCSGRLNFLATFLPSKRCYKNNSKAESVYLHIKQIQQHRAQLHINSGMDKDQNLNSIPSSLLSLHFITKEKQQLSKRGDSQERQLLLFISMFDSRSGISNIDGMLWACQIQSRTKTNHIVSLLFS